MQNSSSFAIPEISPFQIGGGGLGSLSKNVNLFRGDVNFSLNLVSLKGRNGLNVQVSALYESNVNLITESVNLNAPTGTLGLGWSFSYAKIAVATNGSGAKIDHDYFYVEHQGRNRLYRSSRKWKRGTLSSTFSAQLELKKMDKGLQQEFFNQGLHLDLNSNISIDEEKKSWSITDSRHEISYNLTLSDDGATIGIFDGGTAYDLESFQFWRIRYYQEYERWEITKEDGNTMVFGGGVVNKNDGSHDSLGNSIQWGVKWGNWIGPSMLTHDQQTSNRVQQQYPSIYNHSKSYSPWEDAITFEYEQTKQAVGNEGLPYTKACYLSKIVDVFQREIHFNYQPKDVREYQDPNKSIPNDVPDAFQSRYETKYLQQIDLLNADKSPLFKTIFKYPSSEELKIYANPLPANPDSFIKRTLTAITKELPEGNSLPNVNFLYQSNQDSNAGALKQIEYPAGGKVSYEYLEVQPQKSNRLLSPILNPLDGGVPRVWFGDDYAVVTWNDTRGKIVVEIYTWVGYWHKWHEAIEIDETITADDLIVAQEAEYFTLYYSQINRDSSTFRTFHKDNRKLGNWLPEGNPLNINSAQVELIQGSDFYAINDYANALIKLYSWNQYQREWKDDSSFITDHAPCSSPPYGTFRYFVTAVANKLIVLCYNVDSFQGQNISIFYLDKMNKWNRGGDLDATDITISGTTAEEINQNFQWEASGSFVAASYITQQGQGFARFSLNIFSWKTEQNVLELTNAFSKNDIQQATLDSGVLPFSLRPTVTAESMISIGPNLFRYNGNEWLYNNNLQLQLPVTPENIFWFSTGPDYVLKTENSVDQIIGELQFFNPNTTINNWESTPIAINTPNAPQSNRLTHYFPTAGKDFCTWNTQLFARDKTLDWSEVPNDPLYDFSNLYPDLNTSSIINQSPGFMAFLVTENGAPRGTNVLILKNGTVDAISNLITENFFQPVDNKGYYVKSLNGVLPYGPDSFITFGPLDADFDHAQHISLNRNLGLSLNQPIKDFVVANVRMNDGFQSVEHTFGYDVKTAIFDPSGTVAKYYNAWDYAGSFVTYLSDAKNGYTEHFFFNGLPVASDDDSYTLPSALDGQRKESISYKYQGPDLQAVEVSRNAFSWIPKYSIKDIDTGATICIQGVYVDDSQSINVRDGVTVQTDMAYSESSGLKISGKVTTLNAQGKEELHSTYSKLGYGQYDVLRYQHILNQVIQTKKSVQVKGEDSIVTSVVVNTWKSFSQDTPEGTIELFAAHKKYKWTGGTGTSDYNFQLWSGAAEPPSDWFKKSEVINRTSYGLVQERSDPDGLMTSILHDKNQELTVATFANTSLSDGEAFYYGFEEYEQSQGWKIDESATPIILGNAYTGQNSLQVSPGKKGSSISFTPKLQDNTYLFAFWVKTGLKFESRKSAGWKLNFFHDGSPIGKEKVIQVNPSADQWVFCYELIELSLNGRSGAITVSFTPFNENTDVLFIDNVAFTNYIGQYFANIYEGSDFKITAELGPYNQTVRWVYDSFNRPVAKTGAGENVLSANAQFFYRQTESTQQPSTETPLLNYNFTCHPTGVTFYERFDSGTLLPSYWKADDRANWKIANRRLMTNSSNGSNVLLEKPGLDANYFARLDVYASNKINTAVGLNLGNNLSVLWDPKTKKWELKETGGTTESSDFSSDTPGSSWMIVNTPDAIFFLVDGRLIFSHLPKNPIKGEFGIFASEGIAFANIVLGGQPQIGIEFTDGSDKLRQSQSLNGKSAIISGELYDKLGRKAIITKTLELDATENQSLLFYLDSLVKDFNWTTGILAGEISEYYPNDEGYPYSRNLYELSPLGRIVEAGSPGKAFGITDLSNTKPTERHTTQYSYGANKAGGFPKGLNLPDASYFQTILINPDKAKSVQLTDKLGRPIAAGALIDGGQFIYSTHEVTYDKSGSKLSLKLPNYYNPPEVAEKSKWIRQTSVNMLGRITSLGGADMGIKTTIFNRKGLVRFSQDQMLKKSGLVFYAKYDDYGRILEKGTFPIVWNAIQLQDYANDTPGYPSATENVSPSQIMEYDGDGTDPNQIGLLVRVNTLDAGDRSKRVKSEFIYDLFSRMTSRNEQVLNYNEDNHTSGFEYDNLGNLTGLNYPNGLKLGYKHDALGRVSEVFDTDNTYASYKYFPFGSIQEETLFQDNGNSIKRSFEYNSPGWLIQSKDEIIEQNIEYDKNGFDSKPYYNGKIAAQSMNFNIPNSGDFIKELSYKYGYDVSGYLTTAASSIKDVALESGSIGTTKPLTFDKNGNFLKVERGSVEDDYVYNPGTDQVKNIKGDNSDDYNYNINGATVSDKLNGIKKIDYDLVNQMPVSIETTAYGIIGFEYDSLRRRILKNSKDYKRLYLYGAGNTPLVEKEIATGGIKKDTSYIYGPSGLIGCIDSGTVKLILKDYLNSTRAIVDRKGTIDNAYQYLPYGGTLGGDFGSGQFRYLFSGYEWDKETGLYNAGARLYDPKLRRFHSVDSKLQFSSPYTYAGNNPVLLVDPNGDVSGAAIGISVGITFLGALLAIFTFGASLEAAAVVDEATLAVTAATDLAETGAEESAGEGVANSVEVAGENADAPSDLDNAEDNLSNAKKSQAKTARGARVGRVASGSLISMGNSGIHYGATHDHFDGKAFGAALGIGAAVGAVSGVTGGVLSYAADLFIDRFITSGVSQVIAGVVRGFAVGGASGVTGKVTGNAIEQNPLGQGLLGAFITGGVIGGASDVGFTIGQELSYTGNSELLKTSYGWVNTVKGLTRGEVGGVVSVAKATSKNGYNTRHNSVKTRHVNSSLQHPGAFGKAPATGGRHNSSRHTKPNVKNLHRLNSISSGSSAIPGSRISRFSRSAFVQPARLFII